MTKVYNDFGLTVKEKSLIEELRKVDFGRVEIIMEDGQPNRIVQIRENVRLK